MYHRYTRCSFSAFFKAANFFNPRHDFSNSLLIARIAKKKFLCEIIRLCNNEALYGAGNRCFSSIAKVYGHIYRVRLKKERS